MITSATWADVNGDKYPELVVAGDWMPVMVFKNNQGRQLTSTAPAGILNSTGWWNTVKPADIDGDGDLDFILGNLGKNSRLVANLKQPATLHAADFDGNGTVEQIISCYTEDGKAYPMVLKQDLQKQVPSIKKKFIKYTDYAGKQIEEIFSAEVLKTAVVKQATNPNSSFLINQGNFTFTLQAMPLEAQFSPIFGIETLDCNQDGILDIFLTGNFFDVLPEVGRYDANYGLLLQGRGQGKFTVTKPQDLGLLVHGQVRKTRQITGSANRPLLILAKNNDTLQVLSYKK